VLKLGLLCSHPVPAARPSMRQVVQYLDGDAPLPEPPAPCLCQDKRDTNRWLPWTAVARLQP